MPAWAYKCDKCGSGEVVERKDTPKCCQNCGAVLGPNIFEVRDYPKTKTPPEEPPEQKDLEQVGKDHEAGHACKYGCIPPTEEKCAKCSEEKCTERVAKYKHHWKRRKVVKIVKSLLGDDIVGIITDKEVWKDAAKSRAKKLIDAIGVEGEEADEMLKDLEHAIDKGHEKLKRKLK
jgi:hypothetical protein